jgi:hypothetical protein
MTKGMSEPQDPKHSGKRDEKVASTASDDHRADSADDRSDQAPAPQGGKGTPSQAEGERKSDG